MDIFTAIMQIIILAIVCVLAYVARQNYINAKMIETRIASIEGRLDRLERRRL